MKLLKLDVKKDGCHMCRSWTAFNGCDHYYPQDYDNNKPIIDAIVASVHNNTNGIIVETSDFYAGINAALLVLRQNNLLKNTALDKAVAI